MAKMAFLYPGLFDDLYDLTGQCPWKNRTYCSGFSECPYCSSIWSLHGAYQEFQRNMDIVKEEEEKAKFLAKERKKIGYKTKRYCPAGYVAVTKPLARKLYERGKEVTLCGNNIHSFHVFGGWHFGYTVQRDQENKTDCYGVPIDFQDLVWSYASYNLGNELGRYCVFYVKIKDM